MIFFPAKLNASISDGTGPPQKPSARAPGGNKCLYEPQDDFVDSSGFLAITVAHALQTLASNALPSPSPVLDTEQRKNSQRGW